VRFRSQLPVAIVAAALLVLSGCGGGDDKAPESGVDPTGGAKVFADAGCGNCHTLSAADANGTVGPNLDELRPNAARVDRKVRSGGGGMPSFEDRLSDEEIKEVAEFVSTSAGSGGAGASKFTFEPDDKKIEDCRGGDNNCLGQAFGNLAYEEGPAVALQRVEEMQQVDPAIRVGCHPIAHMIGAGGLRHFDGDVGKAFVAGSATCGAGYFHGLLQWKLAGLEEDEVGPAARTACDEDEIRANAFNYYQCVHGLGHGLMLYTGLELPIALRLCHQLETDFDQVSCSGGVFMENLSSSFGLKTRWLKDSNLLYPCDNDKLVVEQDKLYCYLLVSSRILPAVGWDWKKAADWCRRSEPNFVDICFQSYGRDASGSATQQAEGIRRNCGQAGSGEGECIYGAARDVINNNARDLEASKLCKIVKAKFRSRCFFGIGTILGTQQADEAGRREACSMFATGRDLADCMEGANS
jgi:mono/diheme cytochrome c family protein